MYSFTVYCDAFSKEEKLAVVDPEASVEATRSEAMLALSFSTLLVKCLKKKLRRSHYGKCLVIFQTDVYLRMC